MGKTSNNLLANICSHEDMLEQLPTPVMAVDNKMKITYVNQAARDFAGKDMKQMLGQPCADIFCTEHCNTSECRMKQAIESGNILKARTKANLNGAPKPLEYTAIPLLKNNKVIGGIEYIVDITNQVAYENKLKEQSQTIREISTPAIKLWDGIVILPVIGVVDSLRAQQMMDRMLDKIMETSAKVIILDIQGVVAVDTAVANHLIKITKATKLMGCTCIISGISPAVAQSIVQLGINLGAINTNSTLNEALKEAFIQLNLQVTSGN